LKSLRLLYPLQYLWIVITASYYLLCFKDFENVLTTFRMELMVIKLEI